MQFAKIVVSLLPVILFLSLLMIFDSFKLVNKKSIVKTIGLGGVAALLCLGINNWLISQFNISFADYTRYGAPAVEEIVKALLIIYLIRSSSIGFMVDAAIFGFAVGTGFSIVENAYFLWSRTDLNIFIWLLRGLGTAVMHGATTAIVAVVSKYLSDRLGAARIYVFVPGLLVAMLIHSIFNHLLIPAQFITILQLVIFPLLFWIVFTSSEKALHRWLEMGLDTEVGLLEFIVSGTTADTKVGQYLHSLKKVMPGEIVADMICFLRIYLELSIRAKGILLMQQSGFKIIVEPEIKEKLNELKYLEKSIGKTGKRAMNTIFRADMKELWQLHLLYSK
jgi:RsiW-degrading membrane proteinase PrsW (M82 family)